MPTIPDPTPAWLKPEHASVFDSYWTQIARKIGHLVGADDPASQVLGLMAPMNIPAAGPLQSLAALGKVAAQSPRAPLDRARALLAQIRASGFDIEDYDPDTAAWLLSENRVSDAGRAVGLRSRRATPAATAKALKAFNALGLDEDAVATLINEP